MRTAVEKTSTLVVVTKGGAEVKFPVVDWKIKHRDTQLTALSWTLPENYGVRPVWFDLSEIAAVYEVK